MSTKFVLLSGVRPKKYYKLITFHHGIRMTDIQLGVTDTKNISSITDLGKLVGIRQYGRSYDPEIMLQFQDKHNLMYEFEPSFGFREAYVEYEYEDEEFSKKRVQERTLLMKIEIEGNDWALRPENVVATQGLDIRWCQP